MLLEEIKKGGNIYVRQRDTEGCRGIKKGGGESH